jgi:hypothetical protein
VFALKYPSLLQFDKNKDKRRIKYNLRTLFGVQRFGKVRYAIANAPLYLNPIHG